MPISPLYTIHQYREDIYKVVAFKRRSDPDALFLHDREDDQHYDAKLDNNFSRARSMVLQYALCNPWELFFTGTLDKTKYDRFNLDTFMGDLSQWIRDKRKAYGVKFQVLLVPEHHEDGAWHVHGLVHDLPIDAVDLFGPSVPKKLRDKDFLNWPDYQAKFGFCSLALIRDPVATAFYISKYVSKDLSRRAGDLGKHLYFHSRPLRKAKKAADVYYFNSGLDRLCTHEYDFCRTGMVFDQNWAFPFVWDGADYPLEDLIPAPLVEPQVSPETLEPPPEVWEQLSM